MNSLKNNNNINKFFIPEAVNHGFEKLLYTNKDFDFLKVPELQLLKIIGVFNQNNFYAHEIHGTSRITVFLFYYNN